MQHCVIRKNADVVKNHQYPTNNHPKIPNQQERSCISVHSLRPDGFSGNIALKAIEGAARFVTDLLRQAFTSSVRSKVGFLVSRPATELIRHHLDPNNHNGAVFLGLNGVVVKSHGSANAKGVANAVEVAARLLEDDITNRIKQDLGAIEPSSVAGK